MRTPNLLLVCFRPLTGNLVISQSITALDPCGHRWGIREVG